MIFDWLAKQADLLGDKPALVDAASERALDYRTLNERAGRFAAYLRNDLALAPGDRVAILAHNSPQVVEVLYGCAKSETLFVPLNWRLAAGELDVILQDSEPALLVAEAAFAEVVAKLDRCPPRLLWLGDVERGLARYEAALKAAPGVLEMRVRDGRDPWAILYTSGTTGRPKGVVQTFDMALYNALNIGFPIGLNASDVSLNMLPMFHTGGLNLYLNPTLLVGGTALIQRTFEPLETLKLLSEHATVFFGVPAVYQLLAQHPAFEATDLSRVRSWACGGAPMPVSLIHRYAERGVVIRQGFGMTETGPTVFLIDETHALAKAGSVGKPQLFVEVRLVDRNGREVKTSELGELLVKGPAVTPGYWRQPEATARTIEDGWLHTGDVARRDEDGYYTIVDRLKDMYISGGENVYPAEVEQVLARHPAVAECAVVGVPDERWGEVGLAAVVLTPGAEVAAEALQAFCREHLAGYKVPKHVRLLTALPRNAAGKVLKAQLRGGTHT
jgi:fatty-acyl-CoA synthase